MERALSVRRPLSDTFFKSNSVRETYKNGDKTVGDRVLRDNFCTKTGGLIAAADMFE